MPDTQPDVAWRSLVQRSIDAWPSPKKDDMLLAKEILQDYGSLDEFLQLLPMHMMFWFFQRRESFMSQDKMSKWSRHRLDDYVLFPAANGFVLRQNCFFVSHFWHSKDDPDHDGQNLRIMQRDLGLHDWSYIWTDWTCIPQDPRDPVEQAYFLRALCTMSGIIRHSGFVWAYPSFEPRLWILYEVAEYLLTCEGCTALTPDIQPFVDHVNEMQKVGVRATLDKHGYRCSYERDMEFLTSWLELLVLLRQLPIEIALLRRIMDVCTWTPQVETASWPPYIELRRFEGTLRFCDEFHRFTPLPRWADGKYSTGTLSKKVPSSEPANTNGESSGAPEGSGDSR